MASRLAQSPRSGIGQMNAKAPEIQLGFCACGGSSNTRVTRAILAALGSSNTRVTQPNQGSRNRIAAPELKRSNTRVTSGSPKGSPNGFSKGPPEGPPQNALNFSNEGPAKPALRRFRVRRKTEFRTGVKIDPMGRFAAHRRLGQQRKGASMSST